MTNKLATATIIIVEDDPNAQLVTMDLLRLAGASQCFARKSVASARAFAERLPTVDMFLVDINMPDQSGYDLLSQVRNNPNLKDARLVAVTAGTLAEDVDKAREADFDGFISKPLKADSFAQQVEQILNGEVVWDWR